MIVAIRRIKDAYVVQDKSMPSGHYTVVSDTPIHLDIQLKNSLKILTFSTSNPLAYHQTNMTLVYSFGMSGITTVYKYDMNEEAYMIFEKVLNSILAMMYNTHIDSIG